MQHFSQFERVCEFFIMSDLDKHYEERVDEEFRSGEVSENVHSIVNAVKSFHEMRQQLARIVYDHVPNHDVLHDMIRAQKVEQYHSIPAKSTCALTKEQISEGILCVLFIRNKMKVFAMHKRFKRILYTFWILVHFSEQVVLDIRNWLNTQVWWNRGHVKNPEQILQRVIAHKDNILFKKAYVKMKDICHYIQNEMTATPINVRQSRR